MKKILTFFLAISLFSCGKQKDDEIVFSISNKTSSSVTAIQLAAENTGTSFELHKLNSVAQGATERIIIAENKLPNSDGGYRLDFVNLGKSRSTKFGYFSNGVELNQSYSIEIQPDTVLVKPQLRD